MQINQRVRKAHFQVSAGSVKKARAKCKEWIEAGRPSTKPVGHVAVVNESDMVYIYHNVKE